MHVLLATLARAKRFVTPTLPHGEDFMGYVAHPASSDEPHGLHVPLSRTMGSQTQTQTHTRAYEAARAEIEAELHGQRLGEVEASDM